MPSLLLHLFIIFLSSFFAYIGVQENKKNRYVSMSPCTGYVVSFILIALFLATRVNLGRDWENYERIYSNVFQQDFSFGESRELGFLWLVRLLNALGLGFQSFIAATSIITVIMLFCAFKKNYAFLPYAIVFFFLGREYPTAINTIRQGISTLCFLSAVQYINDESRYSLIKYLFFLLIGFLFHYSIIVFIPFYWIAKLDLKPRTLFVICGVIFLFCNLFLMRIYGDVILAIPKYSGYMDADNVFAEDSTFGLGATLLLILRLFPLLFYGRICDYYPKAKAYFILYAVGVSIYYSFYKFLLITRFTYYLQFCELLVFPCFMCYLIRSKKGLKVITAVMYLSLTLFNFVFLFKEFVSGQIARQDFSIFFIDFYFRG